MSKKTDNKNDKNIKSEPIRDAKGKLLPGKSLPGAGRPKGAKSKHTLLREHLKEAKFDVAKEIMQLYANANKDSDKIRILELILPYTYSKLKDVDLNDEDSKGEKLIINYSKVE